MSLAVRMSKCSDEVYNKKIYCVLKFNLKANGSVFTQFSQFLPIKWLLSQLCTRLIRFHEEYSMNRANGVILCKLSFILKDKRVNICVNRWRLYTSHWLREIPTLLYIPPARRRYPFRTKPPRIVNYRKRPPPPGLVPNKLRLVSK